MSKPKISILDHRVAGWYYPWMMKGRTPSSSPLGSKIRLMKKLGFDGCGTSWWDLVSFYQERGDLSQIKDLCAGIGLPLTAFGFVAEGWAFGKGQAQRNAILLALRSLDLAHAAGCHGPYLLGPFDSGNLRTAASAFREICQYGASLGMNVALEFAGVAAQVRDVNISLELIEMAGTENAGIAIDSYHFFAGGSSLKDLEAFPVSKIQVVHLADAPADLSDPAIELDRLMPGDGQLPLVEFAGILLAKNFRGYWHVECIQGLDYAASLRQVARRGLRATQEVLARAAARTQGTL